MYINLSLSLSSIVVACVIINCTSSSYSPSTRLVCTSPFSTFVSRRYSYAKRLSKPPCRHSSSLRWLTSPTPRRCLPSRPVTIFRLTFGLFWCAWRFLTFAPCCTCVPFGWGAFERLCFAWLRCGIENRTLAFWWWWWTFGKQMLWNLFVIEREKLKSARQSKSHIKSASSSLSWGDVAKRIKGGEKNSFSKSPPTPPLAKRARMKTARVWMRKHPIYAFILSLCFFSLNLSHLLLLTSIARFSIERKKSHHFSQQPGVKITRTQL